MFGDEYLLEANKNKIADDDIVMEADGVIAELSNETILNCIGGPNIEIVITKNENSHERKQYTTTIKKKAENTQLADFVFYHKLGSGQFGSVYLVRAKGIEEYFALKCISKQQIIEESLETHLLVIMIIIK